MFVAVWQISLVGETLNPIQMSNDWLLQILCLVGETLLRFSIINYISPTYIMYTSIPHIRTQVCRYVLYTDVYSYTITYLHLLPILNT